MLVECLGRHPDSRVRANAADALGRSRREHPRGGTLAASAEDAHHRVKGSVLRTLVSPWPEAKPTDGAAFAVERLGKMLLDERSPHRLAAVWVVQRSLTAALQGGLGRRWREVESIVRWAADGDADAKVRARASMVVARLEAATEGLGPKRPAGVGA
ncbi:MAG: hypothetical protein IPJ41_11420 [Phycisphaerales bacterium]|nr:hypothetical protein [Phycisphaerales bacterium]